MVKILSHIPRHSFRYTW